MGGVPLERDVLAFDRRAPRYEAGWRGGWHQEIGRRTVAIALACNPEPARVLDVGCGTGHLLRLLASRLPGALQLVGVDPAPRMVEVARAAQTGDARIRILAGAAEELPFAESSFDLVVSATSFDHWADQGAGLRECARVLAPGGWLVLTDLFTPWLWPTLLLGGRDRARTRASATRLVTEAGFRSPAWHRTYATILGTVTAER
jgi:ubiquinone/menaquinone biosynthesis C-methylase UbiE